MHVWTNRPLAYWPQGIPSPESASSRLTLNWNMTGRDGSGLPRRWPAPSRPRQACAGICFSGPRRLSLPPGVSPVQLARLGGLGLRRLGDMGAHLIDHPFWALDLGFPTSVETVSTPFNKATYPMATTTYYQFPARGDKPPVTLNWYDGALLPPRPEELGDDALNPTGGVHLLRQQGQVDARHLRRQPAAVAGALADTRRRRRRNCRASRRATR